jgi:excisionase family DNA binding protein
VRASVRAELASAPAAPLPEVLTLQQCAELLDLSTKTVTRLERAEELPAHYLSPTERRFRRSEVLAWLSARSVKPKGEAA